MSLYHPIQSSDSQVGLLQNRQQNNEGKCPLEVDQKIENLMDSADIFTDLSKEDLQKGVYQEKGKKKVRRRSLSRNSMENSDDLRCIEGVERLKKSSNITTGTRNRIKREEGMENSTNRASKSGGGKHQKHCLEDAVKPAIHKSGNKMKRKRSSKNVFVASDSQINKRKESKIKKRSISSRKLSSSQPFLAGIGKERVDIQRVNNSQIPSGRDPKSTFHLPTDKVADKKNRVNKGDYSIPEADAFIQVKRHKPKRRSQSFKTLKARMNRLIDTVQTLLIANKDKLEINESLIESRLLECCCIHLEEFFVSEDEEFLSFNNHKKIARATDLFDSIKESSFIIKPVINRIIKMYELVIKDYNIAGSCSSAIDELEECFHTLFGNEECFFNAEAKISLSLTEFVSRMNQFIKYNENEKIKKIIMFCFGDDQKTQNAVWALLSFINHASILDPSDLMSKTIFLNIEKYQEVQLNYQDLPQQKFLWRDRGCMEFFSTVTPYEIIRCFAPMDSNEEEQLNVVNMAYISVNDNVFYDVNNPKPREVWLTKERFFSDLIHAINISGISCSDAEEDAMLQAQALLKCETLKSEKIAEYLENESIPCVELLKLCTNSAWGKGDELLRNTFPKIFSPPFVTLLSQGVKCRIIIDDRDNYRVVLSKTYFTYERIDRDKVNSLYCDKNCPLLKIPLEFTLYRSGENTKGELKFASLPELLVANSSKKRWMLKQALLHQS